MARILVLMLIMGAVSGCQSMQPRCSTHPVSNGDVTECR